MTDYERTLAFVSKLPRECCKVEIEPQHITLIQGWDGIIEFKFDERGIYQYDLKF